MPSGLLQHNDSPNSVEVGEKRREAEVAPNEPCFINVHTDSGLKDQRPSSIYNYHSSCKKKDLKSRREREQRRTGAAR